MGVLEDLQARVDRLEAEVFRARQGQREYVRLPEAAKHLGLKDARTVRRLIDEGRIQGAVELDGTNIVVVPVAELDAYQERGRTQKAVP